MTETFDGEAVVVQLRTGLYFAFSPAATLLWEQFYAGAPLGDVIESRGAEDAQRVVDTARWLCAHELLDDEGFGWWSSEEFSSGSEVELGIQKFVDMADLLVLDPIHDLDLDGDGWPVVANRDLDELSR